MTSNFGFIGLGVMGEPMCRHLVLKGGAPVLVFDKVAEPVERLVATGATSVSSLAEIAARASIVFVSLPSGEHLKLVCEGPDGLLAHMHEGQVLVDLGTSPLKLTRELAAAFGAKGVDYADAPVARTRAAAERGELAITVGGAAAVFARVEPLLRAFATEVTHCGDVGSGQIVKILNNMIMVGTVTALCEAAAIGAANGIGTKALFEAFAKGSADSFALRNHGLKYIAEGQFPTRIFSTRYMLKDVTYALAMAQDSGVEAREAALGAELLQQAADLGFGDDYWPVILKLIDGSAKPDA